MTEVWTAVGIAVGMMTALGVVFAVILATAYRFLRVFEDPRIDATEGMLPGSNCGACGEPGCRALAEKIVTGQASPGKCTVASEGNLSEIAEYLGVDVGGEEKRVARLRCAGDRGNVRELAAYEGHPSCRASVLVDGGGRACAWGCLGLGDCERVCPFGAISMNDAELPVVDVELCTACGDCVDICPQRLFAIQPFSHTILVQCASPLTGAEARARCVVACDACGRCSADAPPGVIQMKDGLPVVRYDVNGEPTSKVTWRCPTGAICTVEGQQFAEPEEDYLGRRNYA